MSMFVNLYDGAIFVSDSHYNEKNQEFLIFLQKLKNKELKTKQLFLMGDMFDFISQESSYFIKKNIKIIKLINELSKTIQIIYLEGNHDYNIKSLFKDVLVVKREYQPLIALYENEKIALSHGDKNISKSYEFYCKVVRNHKILLFINMLDFKNFISKRVYYKLIGKKNCEKFGDFGELAKQRVKYVDENIVVEGHFHQGTQYIFGDKRYINIPSLCCSEEFCILNKGEFKKIKL